MRCIVGTDPGGWGFPSISPRIEIVRRSRHCDGVPRRRPRRADAAPQRLPEPTFFIDVFDVEASRKPRWPLAFRQLGPRSTVRFFGYVSFLSMFD